MGLERKGRLLAWRGVWVVSGFFWIVDGYVEDKAKTALMETTRTHAA